MQIESLQAKRADLVGQLEQHVGQINRINGAVSLLDDLIAECATKEPVSLRSVTEYETAPLAPVTYDAELDGYLAPAGDAA